MRWFWIALIALFALPHVASARVALRASDGRRGPIELAERGDRYAGALVIENDGDAPLTVSRIAAREDDAVRAVRGLSVHPAQVEIPPHQSKTVDVEWAPDARAPAQAFAHLVVTSSDEASGEVAIGVHAQRAGPLGPLEGHLLSALVALPLLGALAALAIALALAKGERVARGVLLAATFGQLALSLLALRRFAPELDRAFGNDGLQLVERAPWIRPLGVEWYLGLDGPAALAVVTFALLGAIGALAAKRRDEGFVGVYLATLGAATAAAVARDLALLVLATGACALGAAILAGSGSNPARRAAGAMAAFVLGALAAIALAAIALRSGSTRTYLVDGSAIAHTWALPELERVSFVRSAGAVLGLPVVEIAVVLSVIGFGALAGLFPMHVWMTDLAETSTPDIAALAVVIVPRVALLGLIRVTSQVLPEGTRWASAAIMALGAITIAHAGLCALAETDLGRLAARFSAAHSGLALVGIGSATPQGLAAAASVLVAGSLAAALVLYAGDFVFERTGDRAGGGLLRAAPLFSLAAILGLLGCGAAPLTAAFWSALLAVIGGAPVHPAIAAFTALGVAIVAAAALRAVDRSIFGESAKAVLDLSPREAWTFGALAVAIVALGAWPSPMLGLLAGTLRDAAARAGPQALGF